MCANFEYEDKIIDRIVKPYQILSIVLGILLFISIIGNIYLSTKKVDITLVANNNEKSDITQTNE